MLLKKLFSKLVLSLFPKTKSYSEKTLGEKLIVTGTVKTGFRSGFKKHRKRS